MSALTTPTPSRTRPPRTLTRRRFLQGAGLSVGALGLYSLEFARHNVEIVHLDIPIHDLPAPFHGFRVVQLSDIHLEGFTEPAFLRHAVRLINALAPDLVLISGDFITHGPPRLTPERAIYTCAEALQELTCPRRIGCLGNHDSVVGQTFIARVLRERGTPILLNRHMPVERGGERLWVAGVEDPATSYPNLDLALPREDGPVILLAHAPDYADRVVAHPRGARVDLMLSGHSHGGQIRLPFVGPLILPPMGQKYVQGHYRIGDRLQLYVNRGLGSVGLPFRLNCPPEITVHTLRPI